ncbi:radical SAM family heme chaperone HemW [Geminisphaera colitermitum]|uniref:radical SAM family heme chaperone HemW n=1 Tax=Geminisphaera colitermitum TaxID=1148786 RepID=UPI0005BA0463
MSEMRTEEAKIQNGGSLGLYIHVPFCARTCDFCAFYQESPTAQSIRDYLQTLPREAALVEWDQPISTIFFGGGTPGLLSPRDLDTLCGIVHDICERAAHAASPPPPAATPTSPAEWSVEMAPGSVTTERLAVLRDAGVTRISMGAQSFQPALLDALGRQHTREQVFRAYDRVRAAGFASVNIDMMFALPGQDETAWIADLEQAIALAPDHLSTYCLTFEEDTKLWVKLSQSKVKLDPEHEARLYETTWARLAQAGYAQYEISNFARPGHACLHNLNTWRMHTWAGLGPAAASQHAGWRGANIADLTQWRAHVDAGRRATEDRTPLTPALLMEDAAIFGLRMNEGVDLDALAARFPDAEARLPLARLRAAAARLVATGLAEQTDNGNNDGHHHLRLTPRGRLLADAVGAELVGALTEAAA